MRRSQSSPANVLEVCMMNDAAEELRVLVRYTFGSLNVLREQDVAPKEKKVKRKLESVVCDEWVWRGVVRSRESDSEYDSECYSYSEEEEEEKKEEMDVEDDEEEKEEEEEVESEYADSDEEEMRAMRQFRDEGKQDTARLRNVIHPLVLAVRYDAAACAKYLLNEKKVVEDVTALTTLNPALGAVIAQAGGVTAVCARVFGPESLKKQGRVLLQAAVLLDDVESFKKNAAQFRADGFDTAQLAKSSKAFASLLEFAVDRQCFNCAAYLLQNCEFREKEVVSAYSLLAGQVSGMNVSLEPTPQTRPRRGQKDSSVKLYAAMVRLIQLIPAGLKERVLGMLVKTFMQVNRVHLAEDVMQQAVQSAESGEGGEKTEGGEGAGKMEGGLKELEEMDGMVEYVVNAMNAEGMRFLIDTLGLKAKLMKENPRGYTVIEQVMAKYIEEAVHARAVRESSGEDQMEVEKKTEKKELELEKGSEEEKTRVKLYRLLRNEPQRVAAMLELVLKASDGQKRELVTMEDVQKRVKKDAQQVSKNTRGRRCVAPRKQDAEYTYKCNATTQALEQTQKRVERCA